MIGLFATDLLISGRRPHAVEFREAIAWSVFYVAVALGFSVVFGALAGWSYGAEYFAGYIVEKSLSVDNLFGVTEEAYIVFAANAFALLGLRALYFLVSGLLGRLVYLSTGLSVILLFIGVKLVLHFLQEQDDSIPEVSIGLSLAVIVSVLAAATIASVIKARRDPTARAHAGSLRGHRPAEAEGAAGPAAMADGWR